MNKKLELADIRAVIQLALEGMPSLVSLAAVMRDLAAVPSECRALLGVALVDVAVVSLVQEYINEVHGDPADLEALAKEIRELAKAGQIPSAALLRQQGGAIAIRNASASVADSASMQGWDPCACGAERIPPAARALQVRDQIGVHVRASDGKCTAGATPGGSSMLN